MDTCALVLLPYLALISLIPYFISEIVFNGSPCRTCGGLIYVFAGWIDATTPGRRLPEPKNMGILSRQTMTRWTSPQ
jgi:hypothetical protein